MSISATKLLTYLDTLEASYQTAGDAARGAVLGRLPNLIVGGDGSVGSTEYGSGDGAFILAMSAPTSAMIAATAPDAVNLSVYRAWLSALQAYIRSAFGTLAVAGQPVTTLDSFASYQNAGAIFSFLIGPNTAYLNFLSANSQGNALLSPGNVFAPLTRFGTAIVGAGAGAVAYTNLASIPTVNVPTAGATQQGYTASKGLQALVTTAINGTLTVTVTGTGQTSAGLSAAGRTWTATLSGLAAGAAVAFAPAIAGDRISDVTAVSGTGAATSGAFNLNSVIERVVS